MTRARVFDRWMELPNDDDSHSKWKLLNLFTKKCCYVTTTEREIISANFSLSSSSSSHA